MFKIITYNVFEWNNINKKNNFLNQTNYILSFDADVIGLQEAILTEYDIKKKFKNYNIVPCVFKTYFSGEYDYGCVMLIKKKYKIINQKCVIFKNNPDEHRSYVRVDLKIDEDIISFYNTHLEVAGNDQKFRMFQIEKIVEDCGDRKCVIMGDLNSFSKYDLEDYSKESKEKILSGLQKFQIKKLEDMTLVEKYVEEHGFLSSTFIYPNTNLTSTKYNNRSDFIYLSPNFMKDYIVDNSYIDKTGQKNNLPYISDHFPVICDFSFTKVENMKMLEEVIGKIENYSPKYWELFKNYIRHILETKKYFSTKFSKMIGEGFNACVFQIDKESVIKIQKTIGNINSIRQEYYIYKLLKRYKFPVGEIIFVDPLYACLVKKNYENKGTHQFASYIPKLSKIQRNKLEKIFERSWEFSRKTKIGLDLKADNLYWDGKEWILVDCGPRIEYLPFGFSLNYNRFNATERFEKYLEQWRKNDPEL